VLPEFNYSYRKLYVHNDQKCSPAKRSKSAVLVSSDVDSDRLDGIATFGLNPPPRHSSGRNVA
jgi:hypothetical protein